MGRGRLCRRKSIALLTSCLYYGRAHGLAFNSDRSPESGEVRQMHARPDRGHEPGRRLPPPLDHDLLPHRHFIQKSREAGPSIPHIDFPHDAPLLEFICTQQMYTICRENASSCDDSADSHVAELSARTQKKSLWWAREDLNLGPLLLKRTPGRTTTSSEPPKNKAHIDNI